WGRRTGHRRWDRRGADRGDRGRGRWHCRAAAAQRPLQLPPARRSAGGDPMSERMGGEQQERVAALPPLPVLAGRGMALFANGGRPYAVQQADGSYRWVYEELRSALVAAHLAGESTLALSSLDARGAARWACLDVDVPGSLPQLLELRAALAEPGELGLGGL